VAARIRRRRLPLLLALPMLAILLGLGTWQMERRAWKEGLLADIAAGLARPPAALPAAIPHPEAWAWRPVSVDGVWDHRHEMHLLGRTLDGRAGLHIVTPLLRSDGGPAVIVDRGWAPDADAAIDRPSGPVHLEGIARLPGPQGAFQPGNDAATNQWFWIDLPAMADAAGLSAAAPVVVDAAAGPDVGVYPVGGQSRIDLPNDHLQYAITWYAFAAILIAIFLLDRRRTRRTDPT
jgi:surfeit locus 1 family protein